MADVITDSILRSWRESLRLGEAVKTKDGRSGAVSGKGDGGKAIVLINAYDREAPTDMVQIAPEELFPAWWPEEKLSDIERELAQAAMAIAPAINGGVEDTIRYTVGDEAMERFFKAVQGMEKKK